MLAPNLLTAGRLDRTVQGRVSLGVYCGNAGSIRGDP